MTPTLWGRWQTRLWLLATIGLFVTLIFAYLYQQSPETIDQTPFVLLAYILGFGFIWDIIYNQIQQYRWDRDWPPTFQLGAGILEGLFIWLLVWLWPRLQAGSPLPGIRPDLMFGQFVAHYATVWVTTFLASQSLLRIIYPRWRYRGGQWLWRW